MSRFKVYKYLIVIVYLVILYSFQVWLIGLDLITYDFVIQLTILNIFIMIGIYSFRGFDNTKIRSFNELLIAYSIGSLLGAFFAMVIVLLLPEKIDREVFVFTTLIAAFGLPILQFFAIKETIKRMPAQKYLVISKNNEFKDLLNEIENVSMNKMRFVQYVEPSDFNVDIILNNKNYDHILLTDPEFARTFEKEIILASNNDTRIDLLPNLVEGTLKRIPLEVVEKFRDYYEVIFSNIYLTKSKRVFDVIMSVLGLIITLPISIYLSFAIPIESGFPIIFKHDRIGIFMKKFKFKKFRSLKKIKKEEIEKNDDPNNTIDSRITKTGKFIRKVRFDEIPQFINVIQGDMSVIGPRPEMPVYHEKCMKNIPFYAFRYRSKPGITGWAQINYNHTSTLEDYKIKTEYDLYYIKNQNISLDIEIFLKTIETMLGMRGAK